MDSAKVKAEKAKKASYETAKLDGEIKNILLAAIADALRINSKKILEANKKDCGTAKNHIGQALYQRLIFNEKKMGESIEGIESLIKLDDPVGATLDMTELDIGLDLYQVSTPIGVIGCVFEARPDALIQISSLCLKSGNSIILKGGSEAGNTNRALYEVVCDATKSTPQIDGWIQLVESREEVKELLGLSEYIDLMIPRGSNEFVKYIQNNTKIPVLGHAAGICHVYIDSNADLEKALNIAFDSKCQYPAVCNAMETLLVSNDIADTFLPKIWEKYKEAGVQVKGCSRSCEIVGEFTLADDIDFFTEYNDLILNVKVVDDVETACKWINVHGSHHTDSIVTEDENNAKKFIESVDSSSVMWNASTRFADGFRYGLGAEVGISTNKIHARGPVGLKGLTTYKYILKGCGQTVTNYTTKNYTHKKTQKKWKNQKP